MTSMSAIPKRKFKKQVYGKANSRSNWNVGSFFEEDELIASEPTYVSKRKRPSPPASRAVEKKEPEKGNVEASRPTPKRHNTFDVPSSEDEIESPVRTISTGFQVKNTLFDDTDSSVAKLAPWERRKAQSNRNVASKASKATPASPDAQLKQDLARATLSPERQNTLSPSPKGLNTVEKTTSPSNSRNIQPGIDASSAAARLAARRNGAARAIPKRAALTVDESESTPRKRARTVTPSREIECDIVMTEPITELHGDMPADFTRKAERGTDIYAFPTSSDDETSTSKSRAPAASVAAKPSKRDKPKVYSSKPRTKTGTSAPARLADMLSTDTDTTEPPTRSPSIASRRSTPQKTPSTPPSGKISSPETALRQKAGMTPKQAQLWSQLLPMDTVVPSPSALALRDLTISGAQRVGANSTLRRLVKSQSDVPVQRTRLVDRLKASAPASDNESTGDEDENTGDAEENRVAKPEIATEQERPAKLDRKPSQISQSQSQSTTAGPKITYSSMRSFLPEDNVQEDFMAGLEPEKPQNNVHTKATAKGISNSQKSTYDLDDMDEGESGQGGIRNIHELRASGRTMSGMYDIEELLSEIQNHNTSHRSRRRSALIELATKLTDKAFATRLIGQSLEAELASECGVAADEVADFVIAVIITLILSSEPPEHTVRSLHGQGVTAWLGKLLDKDSDIGGLAKDRKSNMSKSAQTSLISFVDMLKQLSALWGEQLPGIVTTRLFALKALDLLTSKLRRAGERSDLMDSDQVALILPGSSDISIGEKQVDLALSISILESLSTTPASLQWPTASIQTIAGTLPRLNTGTPPLRHAFFLMLRLCLNLTNDNARNCELLSDVAVVPFLLSSIKEGFNGFEIEVEDEKRALALDLLVLGMGIMINLAEQCDNAREHAAKEEEVLSSLIAIFQQGQKHMLDAESVEESVSNVAFGYLAVMLSNFCDNPEAKALIASKLPGKNLNMLIEAVEEFVLHHQKVDTMNFEGEEGAEVWGAFTEKLKAVLARLKVAELNM